MIGTILNAAGILVGGCIGLMRSKVLPLAVESYLKLALAAFTIFYGLRLTWLSLGGSFLQVVKQCLILLVAMMLGRLAGRLVKLQKISNRLGRGAHDRLVNGRTGGESRLSVAFKTSTVLYCLAPLGLVGAVVDGLSHSDYFYPLAVKAVMDGLATAGLILMLGWGVLLSIVPVLAFQGTINLVCSNLLQPFLAERGLIESVNGIAGILICSVALIMLGVKRIELADYLPGLAFAPLLTWVFK
jgi:uncharacterized membrane protein YqgA involved in biofilm formation